MSDLLNLLMLVCAAVGSMAFGVLAAYAIFRVGFCLMRPQRRMVPTVKSRPETASLLID
jgi:ABC-type glycerol-3-phosphate transport system permease component